MKAVELLVRDALPGTTGDHLTGLDSKGLEKVMLAVAQQHPERFSEVSKRLADIGRTAAYMQGETVTMADFKPVVDRDKILGEMDQEVAAARVLYPDDAEFKAEREQIWHRWNSLLEKSTMAAAVKHRNNLGYAVASGSRGKPAQLQAMLSTPGIYAYNGQVVPMFVRHGFNDGLRPGEYMAGTFGGREAVVASKTATAKGGYLGKLMSQAGSNVPVTVKDCDTGNGIDLASDDESLKNRVLAADTAGFKTGTLVDANVLRQIKKQRIEKVVVRSPLTCQAEHGVCSKCMGADPAGKMFAVGSSVGITSANAIGEPIAQGSLNTKHVGGQASKKREFAGFDAINRFVESPEVFPDKAVVSEVDGKVDSIRPAPQGGIYVLVGDQEHYVLPGYEISVKVGDTVEAGQQLSEGIGDPADVVRLRGLGEGRRYYAERFNQLLAESGMPTDMRNTELAARSALDHVRLTATDPGDDTLPDDIVSYEKARRMFTPPDDADERDPKLAQGRFLSRDALHYSIGTRITPSVVDRLKSAGVGKILTSEKAPDFEPEMVRLQQASHANTDWLASMNTNYLARQLESSASRGDTTNIESNHHFVPRLAYGVGFGDSVGETGKF